MMISNNLFLLLCFLVTSCINSREREPFLYIRNTALQLLAASPRFNLDVWARVDETNDYNFSAFDDHYICVSMLDEVQDCRLLKKVVSTYTLANTHAYGQVVFEFLLLAPAKTNTTAIDLYAMPNVEGTFELVEYNNVSIEIVPHDTGMKNFRKYVALQKISQNDVSQQFPLSTVTVILCNGFNESTKNFLLALGAADLRVISLSGSERILCEDALGMHIMCCTFGKSIPLKILTSDIISSFTI